MTKKLNKNELVALAFKKINENNTSLREIIDIIRPIADDITELLEAYMGILQKRPKLDPHLIPKKGEIASTIAHADFDPDYDPEKIAPREQ